MTIKKWLKIVPSMIGTWIITFGLSYIWANIFYFIGSSIMCYYNYKIKNDEQMVLFGSYVIAAVVGVIYNYYKVLIWAMIYNYI